MSFLNQAWPWYVSGPLLALNMFMLTWFGKKFGISSSLKTLCSIGGAGKKVPFFNYDWKSDTWNLVYIAGSMLGGFIAFHYMHAGQDIVLNIHAVANMNSLGIEGASYTFLPKEIFSFTPKNIVVMLSGGFLVGFGTRYANGCTSGHAISGLSNLQVPSLVAVAGFFIGGLLMTWFILPLIYP